MPTIQNNLHKRSLRGHFHFFTPPHNIVHRQSPTGWASKTLVKAKPNRTEPNEATEKEAEPTHKKQKFVSVRGARIGVQVDAYVRTYAREKKPNGTTELK